MFGVVVPVLPADAATTVMTAVTDQISANALVIVSLIGFTAAITFVIRWFTKHAKIKA